jgi:hypothetical protein
MRVSAVRLTLKLMSAAVRSPESTVRSHRTVQVVQPARLPLAELPEPVPAVQRTSAAVPGSEVGDQTKAVEDDVTGWTAGQRLGAGQQADGRRRRTMRALVARGAVSGVGSQVTPQGPRTWRGTWR